jgi:hypothetical protein
VLTGKRCDKERYLDKTGRLGYDVRTMTRTTICPKCKGCGEITCEYLPADLTIARINAGLSLRELGRVLNLSAQYLSDVEHGRRLNLSGKTYERLAARWMAACQETSESNKETDR